MPPSTLEALEAAALQLSTAERSQLAERLLISLDEDDEILAAWVEVAEQRGDAFDRGEMQAIDIDDAIAQVRRHFSTISSMPGSVWPNTPKSA